MILEAIHIWNKKFIMFALGKELSIGGSSLLQFVLPLYILLNTGNPVLMGTILAFSALPSIIFSPVGGVVADRFDKRKLLAMTNLFTVIAVVMYLLLANYIEIVSATVLMMIVLLIVSSLVSLTSKAGIPMLVPKDMLIKANSFTFLLATFSSIGIPIFGGFILATFGLTHVLLIGILFYLLAITMNFLVDIPFEKQTKAKGLLRAVLFDIKDGINFITKEKPKIGSVIFGVNMLYCITLLPLMTIALPVLITIYFEKGEATLGITKSIIVFGGIVGVLLVGMLGKKASIVKIRMLLFVSSFALIPTVIAFMWSNNDTFTYIILILSFFIISTISTMLGIICRTYFGKESPEQMVGKVMSLNTSLVVLGTSIGGYLYGFLFNYFIESPTIALAILVGLSLIVAFRFKI